MPQANPLLQCPFLLKSPNSRWIGRVLVHIDDARYGIGSKAEELLKEALRGTRIALRREQNINGLAGRIHDSIKVLLLPFDPDLRLVNPVGLRAN